MPARCSGLESRTCEFSSLCEQTCVLLQKRAATLPVPALPRPYRAFLVIAAQLSAPLSLVYRGALPGLPRGWGL